MSVGRLSGFFQHPFAQHRPTEPRKAERDAWPATSATVADCLALPALKDGARTVLYSTRFTYWVDSRMHTGCFKSATSYAGGDALSIRYDPNHPERNSADPEEKLRTGLLIAASIALAALYLAVALHF